MARHLEAIFPLLWETGDERKEFQSQLYKRPKDWVLFNVPLLQKSSMRKLSSCFIALGTEECFRGVLHLHHSTPVLSSANQFEFAKPRGLSLECLCCWQGHNFYMNLDFFCCLERWYEH